MVSFTDHLNVPINSFYVFLVYAVAVSSMHICEQETAKYRPSSSLERVHFPNETFIDPVLR